ncbi:MAG: methyltransferase domain-containing protein [Planctomycetota bacterium]
MVSLRSMTVPEAHKDPRLARYPLRRLRLPMAEGTVSIVLPKGASWMQRELGAVIQGDEPPYWADVWPAAVAISRWLSRRRNLSGVRVLDLGCGLGVPGTAAARCGALVTFADRQPDALAFAEFNAKHQTASREARAAGVGTAAAHQPAAAVRCVVHDWHQGTLPSTFDLICLADVSYRPVHHAPLLRHLRACLADGGMCLHADPQRRESDGFLVQVRREFATREELVDTHFEDSRRQVRMTFVARREEVLERWLEVRHPRSAETTTDDSTIAR